MVCVNTVHCNKYRDYLRDKILSLKCNIKYSLCNSTVVSHKTRVLLNLKVKILGGLNRILYARYQEKLSFIYTKSRIIIIQCTFVSVLFRFIICCNIQNCAGKNTIPGTTIFFRYNSHTVWF